jgi:hypothetical protein
MIESSAGSNMDPTRISPETSTIKAGLLKN